MVGSVGLVECSIDTGRQQGKTSGFRVYSLFCRYVSRPASSTAICSLSTFIPNDLDVGIGVFNVGSGFVLA